MNVISIFSGAMGLDLGLEQAGFKTVIAVENDKHAQATIKANRPHVKIFNDAFTVTQEELLSNGPVDVIVGGPPCQSWSSAGKHAGLNDHRGLCIPRFLDIIDMIKPHVVIMENVMGLTTASIDDVKGAMPPYIINRLTQSGYETSYDEVNAADYGSPQNRKRVIFMASKSSPPKLIPTHARIQQLDLFFTVPELPKWKTLHEAIADLQDEPGEGASYPETQLKYLKLLTEGQDWRDLPDNLKAEAMGGALHSPGGKTSFFRRLIWNAPSPTLVCCPTQKSTCLCHPSKNRPLSIKEYARIQGFPEDWKFCGPTAAKYKQIGNAVPVQLAEAIGKAIVTTQKGIS